MVLWWSSSSTVVCCAGLCVQPKTPQRTRKRIHRLTYQITWNFKVREGQAVALLWILA